MGGPVATSNTTNTIRNNTHDSGPAALGRPFQENQQLEATMSCQGQRTEEEDYAKIFPAEDSLFEEKKFGWRNALHLIMKTLMKCGGGSEGMNSCTELLGLSINRMSESTYTCKLFHACVCISNNYYVNSNQRSIERSVLIKR